MADKLNELAGKFGKGGAPKGLGVGMKLLAVAAAGVYGLKESMYTGKKSEIAFFQFFKSNMIPSYNIMYKKDVCKIKFKLQL